MIGGITVFSGDSIPPLTAICRTIDLKDHHYRPPSNKRYHTLHFGCNETLKKNQVDRHAQRCSSCYAVTCVDCSVTFPGNDYAGHLTCVSEAEKYEKSVYKGKKAKTSPQDAWAETIQSAAAQAASAPQHIRSYVLQLAECPNVPRNEKKFINFAKNSLRIHSPATLQAIWDFVASKKENASQEPAKDANDEVTEKTSVGEVESAKHEPSGSEPTEPAVETKKKKKKKDKNGEGVITATEPMVTCTSNGNEVSESKKEKKSKKRKVTELESTVSGGPSGSQSCEVEEKKTKKKKKDKQRKQTTM